MCAAIGHPQMVDDPRYITNTDRVEHRSECVGELNAIFATNTTSHWVDLIVGAGVSMRAYQYSFGSGLKPSSFGP
ncbi:MAG: hypothetical protein Ct9H300mP11_26740 [Chloroflexota bacterium]|nr:MAG: hypothetical protein Ct9H300mP11_26740 [Chloroflexota bacterium]